jgi:hypothetical protein
VTGLADVTVVPPAGDARVYLAAARRGTPAHKPTGDGITRCGRSTRTGQTMTASKAIEALAVTWCPVCWTPGLGVDRTPGVPAADAALKPIPLRSYWRHVQTAARRVQVVDVSATLVVANTLHPYPGGGWRRSGRAPITVPREQWHGLYRRETADERAATVAGGAK